MTIYIDEAIRRLNAEYSARFGYTTSLGAENANVKVLAAALEELGWQPPVDPLVLRAREIVARVAREHRFTEHARLVESGENDDGLEMQIALVALREGAGQ